MAELMCAGRRAHLILDVDDTLVATCATGWRKCVRVAEVMKLRSPDRTLFTRLYGTMSFKECVARVHPGVDVIEYARRYDALAAEFPVEPIGDAARFVAAARHAGFDVGVLTNGPGAKTIRKLAALGLSTGDFGFVRHADTARIRKPAPAAFQAVLDEFGICARCSWYASDQPTDWRGAADVGLRTIGILSGVPDTAGLGLLPVVTAPALDTLIGCLATMRERDPNAPAVYDGASIRAVSLDAGFTLITDVRTPRDLLGALAPAGAPIDRVLAECARLLDGGEDWWRSDTTVGACLHRYYEAVLTGLGLPGIAAEDLVTAYTRPANWKALPGAVELVADLERRGLRTVVLSNWQSNLGEVLAHAGIRVHAAVSSASAGVAKPDPAALTAAAIAAGVAVDEMIHCGDNAYTDVGAAMRAARPSILVDAPGTAAARASMRLLRRTAQVA